MAKNRDIKPILSDKDKLELLQDPIRAAQIIFDPIYNRGFAPHQEERFKAAWKAHYVVDDSGRDNAKTFIYYLIAHLKCILIDNQKWGFISHTFGGAKDIFVKYVDRWFEECPVYRAEVRGKTENSEAKPFHGPDMHSIKYRNRSEFVVIPPYVMRGKGLRLRSQRWNGGIVNEWTFFPSQEVLTNVVGPIVTEVKHPNFVETGDMVYDNQIIFESSANYKMNPAYKRVEYVKKKMESGDKRFVYFNRNYTHVTKEFLWTIDMTQLEMDKATMDKDSFDMEWLGKWVEGGSDVYPSTLFFPLFVPYVQIEFKGDKKARYFAGCDVAKGYQNKGDFFTLTVIKYHKKNGKEDTVVHAIKVRGVSEDEMADILHTADDAFNFIYLAMDPGGGGHWVAERLELEKITVNGEEKEVTPILRVDDEDKEGHHCLLWISRNETVKKAYGKMLGDDVLVDKIHTIAKARMEKERIKLPSQYEEFTIVNGKSVPIKEYDLKGKKAVLDVIKDIKAESGNIGRAKDANGLPIKSKNGVFKYIKQHGKTDAFMSFIYALFAIDLYETLQAKDAIDSEIKKTIMVTDDGGFDENEVINMPV